MTNQSTSMLWAHFRFSVIGALLAAPAPRGELKAAIGSLADKVWTHPITGKEVQFAFNTIERWYYKARDEPQDPVGVLRRAIRKDAGKVSLNPQLAGYLRQQYRHHGDWSYQLHYDNLASAVKADAALGSLGSYSTIRRFMQASGMRRKRRLPKGRAGEVRAARQRDHREIRSYEAEYVGSLWHLDFHHGSLKVLTGQGQWQRPIVLGILDDHSRLCCHLQWYLTETTEDLVHGFSQAIQKRGLPRALLTDNGSAMLSEEFTAGLLSLGILHEKTLAYAPHQNGKQERLWATLEGRLMPMLSGVELTLDFLNNATQAWMEIDYNRAVHRELSMSPVERFRKAPDVLRASPSSQVIRQAFRLPATRRQRQSDGTISLEGVRFEIPARFRHFRQVVVRYARWDLTRVDVIDPRDGTILAAIYPLDRTANSDGRRAIVDPDRRLDDDPPEDDAGSAPQDGGPDGGPNGDPDGGANGGPNGGANGGPLPPLLQRILAEYSASGLPPAYLPKQPAQKGDTAQKGDNTP